MDFCFHVAFQSCHFSAVKSADFSERLAAQLEDQRDSYCVCTDNTVLREFGQRWICCACAGQLLTWTVTSLSD